MKRISIITATVVTVLLVQSMHCAPPTLTDDAWPYNFNQKIETTPGGLIAGPKNTGPFIDNVLSQKAYAKLGPKIQFEPLYIYLYFWYWKRQNKWSSGKEVEDLLWASWCSAKENKINFEQPDVSKSEAAKAANKYVNEAILKLLKSDTNKQIYLNLVGLKVLRDANTPDTSLPASMNSTKITYPTTKQDLLNYFDWASIDLAELTTKDILKDTIFEDLKITTDDILEQIYSKEIKEIKNILKILEEGLNLVTRKSEKELYYDGALEGLKKIDTKNNAPIAERITTLLEKLTKEKSALSKTKEELEKEAYDNTITSIVALKKTLTEEFDTTLDPTTSIKDLGIQYKKISTTFKNIKTELDNTANQELKNVITETINEVETTKTDRLNKIEEILNYKVNEELKTLYTTFVNSINQTKTMIDANTQLTTLLDGVKKIATEGDFDVKAMIDGMKEKTAPVLAKHETELLLLALKNDLNKLGTSNDVTTLGNEKTSIANKLTTTKDKFDLITYTADPNDVNFKNIKSDFESAIDKLGKEKADEIQLKIDNPKKSDDRQEQLIKTQEIANKDEYKFKATFFDKLSGKPEEMRDSINKELISLSEKLTNEFKKTDYKDLTEEEKTVPIKALSEKAHTEKRKVELDITDKIIDQALKHKIQTAGNDIGLKAGIVGGSSENIKKAIKYIDDLTPDQIKFLQTDLEKISQLETYGSKIPVAADAALGKIGAGSKKIFDNLARTLKAIAKP